MSWRPRDAGELVGLSADALKFFDLKLQLCLSQSRHARELTTERLDMYSVCILLLQYTYEICIIKNMQDAFFEWDDDKAEANERDHNGVTFWEATEVVSFDANHVEVVDDTHSDDEPRFHAIGFSRRGRLLTVTFTERGQRLRIISAWEAEKDEEQLYEEYSG